MSLLDTLGHQIWKVSWLNPVWHVSTSNIVPCPKRFTPEPQPLKVWMHRLLAPRRAELLFPQQTWRILWERKEGLSCNSLYSRFLYEKRRNEDEATQAHFNGRGRERKAKHLPGARLWNISVGHREQKQASLTSMSAKIERQRRPLVRNDPANYWRFQNLWY